jgi:hypothetical protein
MPRPTRQVARDTHARLCEEAEVVRVALRTCDMAATEVPPNQLNRILAAQTRALVAQRDYMVLPAPNNIATFNRYHREIFTDEFVQSWNTFSDYVDELRAHNVAQGTEDGWYEIRASLRELFGVDISAPDAQGARLAGGADQIVDPDAGFVCDEPLRGRLVAAGSGQNIELGNKSIMVYIVENMVKPHDRFTADKEEDSVRELFDRLEEVHLAPVAQASYKVKVEAVFKCLDGSAKESVVGFKGAATRAEYLELWKDLFRQFGNKAHDVARQFRSITGASPKSTDPADIMKYMNTLKNAAVQLKRLEHPHD